MFPSTARAMLLSQLRMESTLPTITAENDIYNPKNRAPFTRFNFEPRETDVNTIGQNPWVELGGLVRVTLFYPVGGGSDAIYASADKILAKFPANSFLTSGDDSVHIEKSWVELVKESPDGGWISLPVFIRWFANTRATA